MSPLAWGQVRGGEAGAQEPLAEGCRPARKLVTTRAITLQTNRGSTVDNPYSVPLREQPPQRGPRLFTVERLILSIEYHRVVRRLTAEVSES